jgi:hypothetical protein
LKNIVLWQKIFAAEHSAANIQRGEKVFRPAGASFQNVNFEKVLEAFH